MNGEEDENRVLDEAQCWQFLRDNEFGRLAFHLGDEVHIAPINYAVEHDSLLLRTAEGSKLLGIVMNPDVAFEVDSWDEHTATSVIIRGTAHLLDEHAAHRSENVPLRPWVDSLKYNVVEIRPTEVSGRRFHLNRPWLHIRPE